MQDRSIFPWQEVRRAGRCGMDLLAATLLLLFAGRAPAAGSTALSRIAGRIIVLHQASASLLARGAVVHALIATEWVFVTRAPTDIAVNNDQAQCGAMVNLNTPAPPTSSGIVSVVDSPPSGFFPVGTTIVTRTVTLTDGTSSSFPFKVTVKDTEPPTITAPAAVLVNTDLGQCTATGVSLGTPAASDICSLMSVVNDAPAVFPLGDTIVTWTATDAAGNGRTATQTVTVKDGTPPVFSNCPPSGTMAWATCAPGGIGAPVSFSMPTASDNCSTPTVSCDHESGSYFPVGHSTVTATATDAVGNVATCPFSVSVLYNWSDVLQPVNADGSSVFKAGSTVPVKFQLTGASACITNLAATLSCVKVSASENAPVNEAVSTSAATTGNLFRYAGGQYIFNWSTKGLASGLYELHIDLGDGVPHTVRLGLK